MKFPLLIIILSCINCFSQNPLYYNNISGVPEVSYYSQLNESPYIFKDGVLISESVYPIWYKGLMFHKSPGSFTSVNELYSYLGDDAKFNQNPIIPSTYLNKNVASRQSRYFQLGQSSIVDSQSYPNDSTFLLHEKNLTTIYERYTIVHQEIYFKIDNDEFVMLTYSSMTPLYIPTPAEIDKITRYISGENTLETEIERKHSVLFVFLHKENGTWKYVGDIDKVTTFIRNAIPDSTLNQILEYSPASTTVISDIDSSGNRTFTVQ
ncbi:MAG: hypothetical protein WBG46_02120 [Nonlabens sp.]